MNLTSGESSQRNALRVINSSASETRDRQPQRALSMRREQTELPTINEENSSKEDDRESRQPGSRFLSLPRPNLRIVSSISANPGVESHPAARLSRSSQAADQDMLGDDEDRVPDTERSDQRTLSILQNHPNSPLALTRQDGETSQRSRRSSQMRSQRRATSSLLRSGPLRLSNNYLELPSLSQTRASAQRTAAQRNLELLGVTPAVQYSFGEAIVE